MRESGGEWKLLMGCWYTKKLGAVISLIRSVPERPNILLIEPLLSFTPEKMRHSVEEELGALSVLVIAVIADSSVLGKLTNE